MKKHLCFILFVPLICFSCSSHYQGMNFTQVRYQANSESEDLLLKYKKNYISDIANDSYRHRMKQQNVHLFAVEVVNKGIEPIELGKTHYLAVNGLPASMMDSKDLYHATKLNISTMVPIFLLSPLLAFGVETDDEAANEEIHPALFLVGPACVTLVSIGMMSDNLRFRDDLFSRNLYGRRISAGNSQQGVIGVNLAEGVKPRKVELYRVERY